MDSIALLSASLMFAALAASVSAANAEGPSQPVKLVTEEAMVPAKAPGIEIYVRNKRPADMAQFAPDRVVLFVHGATYPAEATFDLPLGDMSWMDYIAARGFDVYMMDVRGYGRSTRPPEMSAAAAENAPFAATRDAVADVGSVVDWILARRGIQKLDLIGWSWGTTIMATYASENAPKVNRLTLYAAVWHRETPSLVQTADKLGAWRGVTREQALTRWLTGVAEDKKADLIPAGWYDQWWAALMVSDPTGAQQTPPVIRAPNGVIQDGREYWSKGKSTYDPAKLTMPVLLIQAEWDQDTPPYMSRALFPLLVNAPEKRYVMVGEGTHHVMLERNRMGLFTEVQTFLEEGLRS